MANKKNEFKTISINGVEYINKQQLAKKLGYSYFGLDLKLKKSSTEVSLLSICKHEYQKGILQCSGSAVCHDT